MEFETNGADLSKLNKLDNKIESNEDDVTYCSIYNWFNL